MNLPQDNEQLRELAAKLLNIAEVSYTADVALTKITVALKAEQTRLKAKLIAKLRESLPKRAKDTEPEIDDDYELGRHHGEVYARNLVIDQVTALLDRLEL